MGDVCVIARRLTDGHVQYGWGGNGGYFANTGLRLLLWYSDPGAVEYLFGLGQTRLIGKQGSEKGGFSLFETHDLTGEAFWLGTTEREIFSKIAFVDYGYFYDLDHKWYYIIPGPFRIKIPMELIEQHLDGEYHEFDYLREIHTRIVRFILEEYGVSDPEFMKNMEDLGYDPKAVWDTVSKGHEPATYILYDKYKEIYKYFDDWIFVRANDDYTEIAEIIMQKKRDTHIETVEYLS